MTDAFEITQRHTTSGRATKVQASATVEPSTANRSCRPQPSAAQPGSDGLKRSGSEIEIFYEANLYLAERAP